jgi:hypothetical protein
MPYLAKPLTLAIEQCPPVNTVYLRWLTPISTWEGWAWDGGEVKTQLQDPTQLSTTDNRNTVALQRPTLNSLTVQASNLSAAQYDSLVSILSSPQVYRQHPNGQREPVLVAADASALRLSNATKSELEITISLPAKNSLTH